MSCNLFDILYLSCETHYEWGSCVRRCWLAWRYIWRCCAPVTGVPDTVITAVPGDVSALAWRRFLRGSVVPCGAVAHQETSRRVSAH